MDVELVKKNIEQTVTLIKENTNYFYQQKIEQGYNKLGRTINEIAQTVNIIEEYKKENSIVLKEEQFNDTLTEAMLALNKKDEILLADILLYDLVDKLEKVTDMIC